MIIQKEHTMRFSFIAVLLCGTLSVLPAQTKYGVGIVIGVPSGLSGAFTNSRGATVDAQLAWSVEDAFFAQGHYNFHLVTLHNDPEHIVRLYGGPGAFLRLSTHKRDLFGFSGNFGVGWAFNNQLEFFSELAPKVGIISATEIDLTGGIGFRYVF